ncbi:Outer membrane protein OmpA [Mariniphaga anaerophila]|uniref:Outer membrane protein OmpA n=1 Tax=Mariniphaga anaerophila TaxID=1484053 RepID=A0A1M4VUV3_9BACT|nr:OmpA family protein [Mariniphaga anaerophila]SHE72613.1 Outer membrane protein OmpA [Mariniphaga anaerophila]
MKHITILVLGLFISSLFLNSCTSIQNANSSQKGTGIGAAAGAALGYLIGGKDNRAAGALVGAAVGGGAGAIIGHKMDKQAEEIETVMPGAEVIRSEEGIQLILDENADVRFEFDSSDLTSEAQTNLNKLVEILSRYADTDIMISGHTDSDGSEAYNQTLSEKRAASVVRFLTSNGIADARLNSVGMGESEPRVSNDTKEGKAQNRRVEFTITANEDMINAAKQEAGEN